jgi:hypothetical protein
MDPQAAPLHAILELNTDLLLNGLDGLSEEEALQRLEGGGNTIAFLATHLRRSNVHRFPLGDSTELGLMAFLVQHDSYHIGQLGFLRRQLGKPAMAYTRGTRDG